MPHIERVPGVKLEYELLPGKGPVVVFLPGFASDMGGTKAMFLWKICAARGQAMLRLDYSGHGASGGNFIDGCIGDWTEDAAAVIAAACGDAAVVLVGSSMGGWIALLLALRMEVVALLLIAPAADFTEAMILPRLSTLHREILQRDGVIYPPSEYGEPIPITLKLIEDGARHVLLDDEVKITCPVRVVHGMRDADVPWRNSLVLAERLASEDVRVVFVKDGDHRLSRPRDLELLGETLIAFLGEGGC